MQKQQCHGWSRIIGLDLSKKTFTGCILSGEGFTKRRMINGGMGVDDKGYLYLISLIEEGDLVVMEAGSSSFCLARFLIDNSNADEVIVLNPANLRMIWDSQKKTDRADAIKLAQYCRDTRRENWATVSVPTDSEQAERSCITYYVDMKEEETMLFNRLFALFNTLGMPNIGKTKFREDPKLRREQTELLLTPYPMALETAVMLNERIDLLQLQLEVYDDRLRDICLSHPKQAVAWLSMPGIGLKNAATLVAYIGDGKRFQKADQLLNYTGLVPRQEQSGTVDRHCRISKRGNSAIRRNLVQGASVVTMMPPTCVLTKFAYRRKMMQQPHGKVMVSVASHMLRVGHALLRNGDVYDAVKTEEGMARFRQKLTSYKLQALIEFIPTKF